MTELQKELLKVEEAAGVLNVSRRRMYDLVGTGEIESVKIGRVRRVPVEALKAFIERLRAEGAEAGETGVRENPIDPGQAGGRAARRPHRGTPGERSAKNGDSPTAA